MKRVMVDRQNQEACTQARSLVSDEALDLSFTSSTEMSGRRWGAVLSRRETPLAVRVEWTELGMKGLREEGLTAIPPIRAQKLWFEVHGLRRGGEPFSASACGCQISIADFKY